MARKVFLSFHYQLDNWRVQQIKNIGAIEEQPLLSANEWEDVAKGGDSAIQAWIDGEMKGKSCNIVLIGSQTAGRKWVEYEFKKAWGDRKGVLGVHIHRLLDRNRQPTTMGRNPFVGFQIGEGSDKKPFDSVVPVYNPSGATSQDVYRTISDNIEDWVEHAIKIRNDW